MTIDEAVEILPLTELAPKLGIQTEIPDGDGKEFECPFCGKKKFNFYADNTNFHCYVCGRSGRGPDLVSYLLDIPAREGVKKFLEMAGGGASVHHLRKPFDKKAHDKVRAKKKAGEVARKTAERERSFQTIRLGIDAELRTLAKMRQWSFAGVSYAQKIGILRFGRHLGFPCWIVTDQSGLSAEARRMNGEYFPSYGERKEAKGLSLKGSIKSWPVGLAPIWLEKESLGLIDKILLVEGQPDLITAINYAVTTGQQNSLLSIAMLGKGIRKLHPEALPLLTDKHIDCFPHTDDEGGMKAFACGMKTARRITAFSFDGLKQVDGRPVNDLNDTAYMDPAEVAKLNLI